MDVSLHMAPVGLGPCHNYLNYIIKIMFLLANEKAGFVVGPDPVPALTCPDTSELFGGAQPSPLPAILSVQTGIQPHLCCVGVPHHSIRNTVLRETGTMCKLKTRL